MQAGSSLMTISREQLLCRLMFPNTPRGNHSPVDKRLVDLSAKAIGIKVHWWPRADNPDSIVPIISIGGISRTWEPLDRDSALGPAPPAIHRPKRTEQTANTSPR